MPTDAVAVPPVCLSPAFPRIDPVPLVHRAEPFDDPAWLFEPRYDGFRALLYGSDEGCHIEVDGEAGGQVDDLRNRVADVLGGREAILDGQIVSLDRKGMPVLGHLLSGGGYLAFAAFDLLWLNGIDLRNRPLKERKEQLAELLPEDTGPLYKVLTIEEHGRALFGAIRRLGLGGIVAKCLLEPYGPATRWFEIPNQGRSGAEGRGEAFQQRFRQGNHRSTR
jgi:bifunctional non-homologous end joining protein LigD